MYLNFSLVENRLTYLNQYSGRSTRVLVIDRHFADILSNFPILDAGIRIYMRVCWYVDRCPSIMDQSAPVVMQSDPIVLWPIDKCRLLLSSSYNIVFTCWNVKKGVKNYFSDLFHKRGGSNPQTHNFCLTKTRCFDKSRHERQNPQGNFWVPSLSNFDEIWMINNLLQNRQLQNL